MKIFKNTKNIENLSRGQGGWGKPPRYPISHSRSPIFNHPYNGGLDPLLFLLSIFYSNRARSTIGAKRHAVSSRTLMFFSEGIYFLKHFFSCGMFGKRTAKEKLLHVVLSRTVSHEHHELSIIS